MDNFVYHMRPEMNEAPPHLHPQTFMEPSPPCAMRINSQSSIILPEGIPVLEEWPNDLMNLAWEEPYAVFPPEASSWHPTAYIDGSIMLPYHIPSNNLASFGHNNVMFKSRNALPVLNQPFIQQRPAKSSTRKRAPKAPTMSAKTWRPHENRIKQLYVNERKSIEELREIMNKELGISATLRQYKVQIQQMKLERNVKAKERKAVVKHIQYRAHAVGKKSSRVRVRGHGINQEKLLRWAKENLVDHPSMFARPPSPLPSCISISTNSVCETPGDVSLAMLKHQRLVDDLTSMSDIKSTFAQRLLRYAQGPKRMLEYHQSREVFNDLQLVLKNDYYVGFRGDEDHWNVSVGENIIQIRNLMNLTQSLHIGEELRDTRELVPVDEDQHQDTALSRVTNDHAAWVTPYGKLQASFWAIPRDSNMKIIGDTTRTVNKTVAARLAFTPNNTGTSPFRLVFDFAPHLDPSATITYQAMIPNSSKVFQIAGFGEVEELVELLEMGKASLSDRDEEGRSLLNYASSHSNVDVCNFLVQKKADVNAIESDGIGYIGPVHSLCAGDDVDAVEITRYERAECLRIMLEADADFSLDGDIGGGLWVNTFLSAIGFKSCAALKHILDHGEPFIDINCAYTTGKEEFSALTSLADECGYSSYYTLDVIDKAILLINRKADVSCRDEIGDTILHTILRSDRWHQNVSRRKARRLGKLQRWELSFQAPKDLLIVFIAAGADVYATNNYNQTPSRVALRYGREHEWIQALELCGYDSKEVLTSNIHHPTRQRQTSKLSFHEYCEQRQQQQHLCRFKEIQSDDSDNESQSSDEDASEEDDSEEDKLEEPRVTTDYTEYVEGRNESMEKPCRVACADDAMDIDLNIKGGKITFNVEETFGSQSLGLDDLLGTEIQGTDVNWDDWVNNGADFMQSFNELNEFLATPFE